MTAFRSKRLLGQVAAALLLTAALGGCSSVVDHIPSSVGGLPEGTPQRPAAPGAYPAVHDMPPARRDTALTEAESQRLREDLKKTRNRVAPGEATDGTPAAGSTGSAPNP